MLEPGRLRIARFGRWLTKEMGACRTAEEKLGAFFYSSIGSPLQASAAARFLRARAARGVSDRKTLAIGLNQMSRWRGG